MKTAKHIQKKKSNQAYCRATSDVYMLENQLARKKIPNVLQWLALPLHVQVQSHPDRGFSWCLSLPPGKFWDSTSK